jgi:hypothetical protein
MKGSQAISSSDLFGEPQQGKLKLTLDTEKSNLGSKLKEMAFNFTVNLAEKAKDVKDKTSNLITRIQNKYGN